MATIAADLSNTWEWPDFERQLKAPIFKAASYLTEPVCKAHEFFRRIQVVDALHPEAAKIANFARKFFLGVGLVVCALFAWTALVGIALRFIACSFQSQPYIYFKGEAAEKLLQDQEFSLFSWNVCCNSGGYSISDGGVVPWASRIDGIVSRIKEKDADVVSLYEVFDPQAGFYLYEQLKSDYSHFYFNIGPRAIGVSSGIFIASKFEIQNPEFIAFPKEMLVGRTKNAEKGVFSFDLQSQGRSFARIFSTHLQHSEECDYPADVEVLARKLEMELIVERIKKTSGAVILTGDLNLDDKEYQNSTWKERFDKHDLYDGYTWGGDEFYAMLVGGKQISPPLNLDHTMVVKNTATIATTLVETGYDAKVFKEAALSDHAGLLSRVYV